MPGLTSNEMATGYHKINGSNTLQDKITHSHKCLSSGSLSNLIDSTDQVIFTMPAKAGGSSMKRFAEACNDDSYKKLGRNFLNSQNQTEQLLTISYEMPGVIASHMYQGQHLIRAIKNLPKGVVLVYIHRQETSRVLSAVRHVVATRRCKNRGSHCYILESELVQLVKSRSFEIGIGATQLLTCETFDTIQSYAPTMVFMNYTKVSNVQRLTAKKYCPDLDTVFDVNKKVDSSVIHVQLNSLGINTTVSLNDWLRAKSSTLEFALGLNNEATCVAKMRRMENQLHSCDEGHMLYRSIEQSN